jgi:hypothetical protein
MMLETPSFRIIGAVTKAARELRDWQPDFGGRGASPTATPFGPAFRSRIPIAGRNGGGSLPMLGGASV